MIKTTTIDVLIQNIYYHVSDPPCLRKKVFVDLAGVLNFLREYKLDIFSREKDETFELKKQLVEVVEDIERELEKLK